MLTAGAVMGVTGCGVSDPAAGVYGPPPDHGIVEEVDEPMPEVYGPPEFFDTEAEEPEETDDESVSIVQDFDAGTAYIVDGDEEIPVEIADGIYGPRIMKCDVDGDGEDEYVISECEGTGTGFSTRGLCIVEKTDSDYRMTRYDWDYFAGIIERRLTYTYDAAEHKVIFWIENEDAIIEYPVTLEGEDELEDVVFTDIVDVYFEDGRVYLSAASGLIFADHGWPEYEQGIEPYAPITIDTDSGIIVGDFTVRPDDGVK